MPTDVQIAVDGGGWLRSYLYNYDGDLYNLIPDASNFSSPTPIRMYKSTNSGASWTALTSTISAQAFFQVSGAPCLIGTKLYLWYVPSGSVTGLAYFDFTTDTFSTISTTGTGGIFAYPFMVGSAASQLYTANFGSSNNVQIAQFVSFAYSNIGTINPVGAYTVTVPEILFFGSSGITHIFYLAQNGPSSTDPSDLGYANIVSGSLSSGTIIRSNFSDTGAALGNFALSGPAVQVGGNIYFSFYDPFAQALRLMSFTDVSSPTFAVSTIDPSVTIAVHSPEPTGGYTNVLGLFGSTLYCFYTNADALGGGDGKLYYRTSTNNGATWSAISVVLQHLDPNDLTPFSIWIPEAIVQVPSSPPASNIIGASYQQVNGNSQSPPQNQRMRFFSQLILATKGKNYVF